MRVTRSTMVIGPVRRLPPSPARDDPPGVTECRTAGLTLGASSIAPAIGDDWAERCGEGVATLLDGYGEGKAWPYASAGGALAMILGGLHFADARRRGDAIEMQAGLFRIGLGGLGVVAGSGLLAGHPAIQSGLDAVRTVLGSVPPPGGATAPGSGAPTLPYRRGWQSGPRG